MIRQIKKEDYESIKKLVYQVHKLHLEHRPDIYIDGNPLPIEYFNNIISDENSLGYVYEENNKIVGFILAMKKTNRAIPIAKQKALRINIPKTMDFLGIKIKLFFCKKTLAKSLSLSDK